MPSSYGPNLTEGDDYWTVRAMETYGGSFVCALAHAAQVADPENLESLKSAFPKVWEEYRPMGQSIKEKAAKAQI